MALTELGERLALIIDAKTDGAVSNIRRLTVEEKAAADQAEVLKARITDLEARQAKSGLSNAAGLQLSKAKNELAGIESTLASGVTPAASRTEQALSKLGLAGTVSGSAITSGLASAGLAVAAFGGFEFIKSGIQDFVNLATEVRSVGQASGATAEDASKLVAISNALGVSANTTALGVFRLGKNIALQPQNLTNLGISIAKNANGTTDLIGTLGNVADAYQHASDGAQRSAIVYEAFGRAGTSLLPILNANKDKLAEIVAEEQKRGHILSQADVQSAQDYQVAIRELQDSFHGLAIEAGKFLVPALTAAADALTKITDFASSGFAHKVIPVAFNAPGGVESGSAAGLFGGGAPTRRDQTLAEISRDKARQAQADLEQQVLSTLASPFDTLAGPAAVQGAKQTLSSALTAVRNAKSEQAAALRALTAARQGSPVASEQSLVAAEARVRAAEASLTKARYIGGDANIKSAQAGVASAQAELNRLRQQGGVDTNTLANAEDRLRKANDAVTTAQHKAAQAQKGVNEAHGLTAQEVLKRFTDQAGSQSQLLRANEQLAVFGVSSVVLGDLNALNKEIPGTLVRVAHTMTDQLAHQLDHQQAQLTQTGQAIASTVGNPRIFFKAGESAREAFVAGYTHDPLRGLLTEGLPHGGHSRANGPNSRLTPGLHTGAGIHIEHNQMNIKSDLSGRDLQRKAQALARKRALSK